jgi:hypothetical protein
MMGSYKDRAKGDVYRPTVQVRKAKNGVPTSVTFGGYTYALVHDKYINGNKNKVNKKEC